MCWFFLNGIVNTGFGVPKAIFRFLDFRRESPDSVYRYRKTKSGIQKRIALVLDGLNDR